MDISKSARSTLILLFFIIAVHVMGQSGNQLIRIHTVSNVSSLGSITNALEGNLIYVESTDTIYYYDGSNWVNLSSTSSSSSTNWELVGNVATLSDFLGTTNNTDLDIRTNNSQRMTIKNDGKVGIGTDSPTGIFEINSPQDTNAVINLSSNSNSNVSLSGSNEHSSHPYWHAFDGDNSTYWRSNYSGTSWQAWYWVTLQFSSTIVLNGYAVTGGGSGQSAPSNLRMQASNNGSSWINLETQNNIPEWDFNPTTESTYSFNCNNTTSYTHYRIRIFSSSSGTLIDPQGNHSGECEIREISLYRDLDTDFIVTTNGNVGVGLENPTEKLHVGGNILASGTITPDYVFEHYFEEESLLKPEYQFTELEKTIEFAKKHHHLPNIPSAEEVKEKGGILLNKAVEQNLEKIEELFIHNYNLNKEIEQMKKIARKHSQR